MRILARRVTWLVVAVALSACSQKPADKAAGGSGSAAAVSAPAGSAAASAAPKAELTPAGKDPWASAAPAQTKTDLGAKVGGGLAKIDAKDDAWGGGALPRKVDVQTIAAPTVEAAPIASFTHGGETAPAAGFTVTYNASTNPTHTQFRDVFQKQHVFEAVAEGLNRTVRIPHTVQIQTVDCHTINAFYDPSSSRIIVCYELLDYFLDVFKPHVKSEEELGNSVMGATMFSFFHEAGHGLIHQLDLPAVGREEDSVDQLATLILIASGDDGVKMALSGAYWFQLQAEGSNKTPFWDEHGFDGQRFYNILCLIYGSNPDKYKGFVESGNLPAERAAKCPAEYAKIDKAWEKLLQPYLTNGAAINIDYHPQVPTSEAPRTTSKDPWGDDGQSGDSTPTVTAPPEPPPPPVVGITCEQVADKAAELIRAETYARAGSADRAELDARLETRLPAAMQQILAQCAKEKWPQPSRQCVLDAKTLTDAGKCQ